MKKCVCKFFCIIVSLLLSSCMTNGSADHGLASTGELNFEFQSQLGYCAAKTQLNSALEMYQADYPDVKVNIEIKEIGSSFDDSVEYCQELGARLMAGKGPDVIFLNNTFFVSRDIYKVQKAGAFEDLTALLSGEPDFQAGNYQKAIFEGTKFLGKQYVIPLNYTIPLFIATQKSITENGIDTAICTNTMNMLGEFTAYWSREKEKESPAYLFPYSRYFNIKQMHGTS